MRIQPRPMANDGEVAAMNAIFLSAAFLNAKFLNAERADTSHVSPAPSHGAG